MPEGSRGRVACLSNAIGKVRSSRVPCYSYSYFSLLGVFSLSMSCSLT